MRLSLRCRLMDFVIKRDANLNFIQRRIVKVMGRTL